MNSLLSIGEMAELNQISIQTLRYYDRIKLLSPIHINKKNGYRYYTFEQSNKIDMIHFMQRLGLSLNQIKFQFEKNDINTLYSLLHTKKEELLTQQSTLLRQQNHLENYLKNLQMLQHTSNNEKVYLEYFDDRFIYLHPVFTAIDDYHSYNFFARKLKEILTDSHISSNQLQNTGSIIRKSAFESGQFLSNELCIFLQDPLPQITSERIKAGTYACIYCHSFKDERRMAEILYTYIENTNLEILGDYICEVLLETPIFEEEITSAFLRLQIPVKLS